MIRTTLIAVFTASMLVATPALAQEAATVATADSEEYGTYLADAEGRSLYLFTTDTQGGEGTEAQVSCTTDACLEAWPPFYTDGEPQAGEGADAAQLGTIEFEGQTMVTYNGWPLYYFVKDEEPGDTEGQDVEGFGGEWYLVTPAGEAVGH